MMVKNIIALIGLSLLLIQCSKDKEEAPFFDGLYLEYKLGNKGKKTYNVSISNKKGFKVIEIEQWPIFDDEVEEYSVDLYGKVYSSGAYKGEFSPIWIPVNKMKVGNTFDGGFLVSRLDNWKRWEVMVVKAPIGRTEIYHDLTTGFLVGMVTTSVSGTTKTVLVDTNADIPVGGK
jgi:hypothetical protein